MRNTKKVVAIALSVGIVASAAVAIVRNRLSQPDARNHPVKARSHPVWKGAVERPWTTKAEAAPPMVIDLLRWDNERQGWKEKPVAAAPSAELSRDIERALNEIPLVVQRAVGPKLLGIYLVNDLGGSAYANSVLDWTGRPVAGFIALDVGALDKKANEWMTWKESSPYKAGDFRINATIADEADNSRASAIRYILLHELGHVLAIGRSEVVDFDLSAGSYENFESVSFTKLSWRIGEDDKGKRYVTRFDLEFTGRGNIPYYAEEGKARANFQMADDYQALGKTDFPTMYATLHPHDDFAESFVTYVHTYLLKKPWSIRISKAQQNWDYLLSWDAAQLRQKREILEKILAESP